VKQICGLRVYWQFARGAVDYQMMKRPVWKILFFGIKDEMIVTISERCKCKPVKSRMSAFEDRFSMTKSSSESAERMRKPGIRLGLTIGDFGDERSMFIEK